MPNGKNQKLNTKRVQQDLYILRDKDWTTGNRLRFTMHGCTIVATSIRCIEISRVGIIVMQYIWYIRLKYIWRARPLHESPRTREIAAHIRDVTSPNCLPIYEQSVYNETLTWDKLESSRILASIDTWVAWIFATASAAANRNVSIVLRRFRQAHER